MKTKLFLLTLIASQFHASAAPAAASENFAAHEWGTFTSVQGADGKLILWSPLASGELPGFVYDRKKPSGHPNLRYVAGKENYAALQRMETPVIYFYSDQERNVDVTVHFPKGVITEWYPYADGIGPSWVQNAAPSNPGVPAADYRNISFDSVGPSKVATESFIRWPDIRVLPTRQLAMGEDSGSTKGTANRYFAARETQSNVIQVNASNGDKKTIESEKFLFYRGLGMFNTPLNVTQHEGSRSWLALSNGGPSDLGKFFVLNVEGNQAQFRSGQGVPVGKEISMSIPAAGELQPLSKVADLLSVEMQRALEGEGLLPAEANAMVQTWRTSWFEEPGLRVLYLLPRPWTDAVLPLNLVPAPREVVRVMVGRAELITRRTEAHVREQIVQFSGTDPKAQSAAVKQFRTLNLGRFADPAIRLAVGEDPDRSLGDAGWALLAASRKSSGWPGQSE